jgi:hypothetical protein
MYPFQPRIHINLASGTRKKYKTSIPTGIDFQHCRLEDCRLEEPNEPPEPFHLNEPPETSHQDETAAPIHQNKPLDTSHPDEPTAPFYEDESQEPFQLNVNQGSQMPPPTSAAQQDEPLDPSQAILLRS